MQRLLGTRDTTGQVWLCRQFYVLVHIASSSMPETTKNQRTCISNATDARQNIDSNLSLCSPAVASAGAN
jgi:hypothetical protein